MIGGVGGKAGDGVAVVAADNGAVGGIGDIGAGAPVHVHLVIVAVVAPADGGVVDTDIGDRQTRSHAWGQQSEGDIVEHQIDVCRGAGMLHGTEGHIGAGAGVGRQGHLELLIAGARRVYTAYGRKGGGIRRVGHHAHLEVAVVAGAVLTSPEGGLQGVDIQIGFYSRQDAIAVAARIGGIEVEAVGVVVAVGSGGMDIGAVGRAAQLVPAGGEGRGAGAIGLEVLGVGQRGGGDVAAGGADSDHTAEGVAAVGASRHYIDVVGGVGGQLADTESGVRNIHDVDNGRVGVEAGEAVDNHPLAVVFVDKREVDAVGGNVGNRQTARTRAVGQGHAGNIDFEAGVGDGAVAVEHDGESLAGEGAEAGIIDTGGIVAEEDIAAGANAFVDGQVVPGALGLRDTGDGNHVQGILRKDYESGVAAAAVIACRAAIVVDYGSAATQGVGAAGGHIHSCNTHRESQGANPRAVVAVAIGTYIGLVESRGEAGGVNRGGGGGERSNVGGKVGVEALETIDELPCRCGSIGPCEDSVRSRVAHCKGRRSCAERGGASVAHREDGARRGLVDSVEQRGAVGRIDPDGDFDVVFAARPDIADGHTRRHGDQDRVVGPDLQTAVVGVDGIECRHCRAALHNGQTTAVPTIAVGVFADDLDLAGCLCRHASWQCHGHYRDQWHQKLVKSFHGVVILVNNKVN